MTSSILLAVGGILWLSLPLWVIVFYMKGRK